MRQISSASLPERHIRVTKQSYIDFGDNFIFGELVYQRVGCRRVGLSASCPVTPPTVLLGLSHYSWIHQ